MEDRYLQVPEVVQEYAEAARLGLAFAGANDMEAASACALVVKVLAVAIIEEHRGHVLPPDHKEDVQEEIAERAAKDSESFTEAIYLLASALLAVLQSGQKALNDGRREEAATSPASPKGPLLWEIAEAD